MSDLWANNNMRKSCSSLVHNTKVKLAKIIENSHFTSILSLLVVYSFIRKDWWWHIFGRVSFQHTFFRKSMAVIILGGVIAHVCPYYTPFLKAQWNKQNYNYAAALSISLGFHCKILIHNRVWRLTWVEVVLYCMHDTAQNKRKYQGHVKCHVYQFMGDVY